MFFHQNIPGIGLKGIKENWRNDILAGFLVFLVSLPLSLGVAMACNLPPFAGILTSIIGGVVISFFQGSSLSIKSPAAGLIIIITGAMSEFGHGDIMNGYKLTLAVIVVSGVIQMLLGSVRVGVLGDFFPSPAVHGMLASIGIIIIGKQFYTLMGVQAPSDDTLQILLNIPSSVKNLNPEILFIGLLCLAILYILPAVNNKYIRKIPAPMVAILVSIPIGYYFDLEHTHKYFFWDGHEYSIGPSFLVTLPSNFSEGFTFPDFDKILSITSLKYIFLLTFVGSIESLVSAKAIDNLDKFKRRSDVNKDLFSIGLGNTICGFLGGLPMITEIVRSSSNAFNEARTSWSNFFHGFFILTFVLLAPGLIHQIPLSALSAMLIYIGIKLASPKVFIEIYKVGWNQFLILFITIVCTIAGNILIGMSAGILVNIFIHLYAGVPFKALFTSKVTLIKNEKEKTYNFLTYDAAIFSNYLYLKNKLDRVPPGYKINLDFSNVQVVDHTFLEHLHNYGEDFVLKGGILNIKGLEHLQPLSSHPLSYRIAKDKTLQENEVVVPRVKLIQDFAKKNGYKYINSTPVIDNNFGKINHEYHRVKYEGNIVTGKIRECNFRISDLSVLKVGDIKAGMYQITAISISNFPMELPQFSLYKENLLDRIKDNTIFNDIDFPDFPAFSNTYNLQTQDEKKIRAFFNNDLISFFENEEVYQIECNSNELFIFKIKASLPYDEVTKLLAYSFRLTNKIIQNYKFNATTLQNIT